MAEILEMILVDQVIPGLIGLSWIGKVIITLIIAETILELVQERQIQDEYEAEIED